MSGTVLEARQRSPIHDHGSSICAVYTVDGILSGDNYKKTANGHIRADYSEDFGWDPVKHPDSRKYIRSPNLQAFERLVRVHFYLAPLENSYQ